MDIVDRLNAVDHMSLEDCFLQSPLFAQAAAEIVRLRKERDEARAAMAWQPIETAPHGEPVLLGWWTQDGHGGVNWDCEVRAATWGWRRGSISNMSQHGQATHWMPLPEGPEATK